MMRLKLLSSILALGLCATSVLAAQQVRYRLIPIVDPPGYFLTPTDMNNRGEVVGAQSGADQRGFYWHEGTLIDIHDQVSPASIFVEAAGINDRSQIDGSYLDPDAGAFRGFLLDRDEVRRIDGPPGADNVFVNAINDREQILGTNFGVAGNEDNFLWDRGTITIFDSSFRPSDINDRSAVSGTQFLDGSARAAIWEDGEISPIGPPSSFGRRINERGQVIGSLSDATGDRAFLWERGRLAVLARLRADQASYFALDIDNAGRIVGETQVVEPENSFQIATVWDDGQVIDLNTLIHPDDPLRGFVMFEVGQLINDRGEIIARGRDLRTGSLGFYFLKPVRR
jgi:uncharacterized membrane protein